jgi:hypothetical protein
VARGIPVATFDEFEVFGHPGTIVFRTRVREDTYDRFQVLADGTIKQGTGRSAPTTLTAAAGERVDFTPHLYSTKTDGSQAPQEITYGASPTARAGWYQDDGLYVRGVAILRLGTDMDLGPDGAALTFGLPVEADSSLGGSYAQGIGHGLFGIKGAAFGGEHIFGAMQIGSPFDFADGNYAGFYPDQTLFATNTMRSTTSNGAAATGWQNFHLFFGYFKA